MAEAGQKVDEERKPLRSLTLVDYGESDIPKFCFLEDRNSQKALGRVEAAQGEVLDRMDYFEDTQTRTREK